MLDATLHEFDRGDENSHQSSKYFIPVSPAPFKPTWKDNFLGFFVGANYDDHYTRQDVRDINHYSWLTFVSVGMATTGATLALNTYLHVSPFAAIPPTAALFTFIDINFVRAEAIAKADRLYQEYFAPYSATYLQKNWLESMRQTTRRWIPLGVRMSVALLTSTVTGGIIIEKVAHKEIEAMAHAAYVHHNQPLIDAEAQKEADYDSRIVQLTKAIDKSRKGELITAPDTAAKIIRLPADQDRYDRAKQALDALTPQIQKAQQDLDAQRNAMAEEYNGVAMPGRTGKPGQGHQYNKAQVLAGEDSRTLSELKAQQAALQVILNGVYEHDQQMLAKDQARAQQQSSELASKRQAAVVTWTDELQKKQQGRAEAFAGFQRAMVDNPQYKKENQERGIFADMYLLHKFLSKPATGPEAKTLALTSQALIFMLEMAAVMGAALRTITPSEMADAEKRAIRNIQIKRRAVADHEQDIHLHKRMQAIIDEPYSPGERSFRPNAKGAQL